jgi:hypothetical protein
MAYFNEDNITEHMCINVAEKVGFKYVFAEELQRQKAKDENRQRYNNKVSRKGYK